MNKHFSEKVIPTFIRLKPKQRKLLAHVARKRGISWASIVRELIDKYLSDLPKQTQDIVYKRSRSVV